MSKKTKKDEKNKITPKMIDGVKDYLNTRLGVYGIKRYEWSDADSTRMNYDHCIEQGVSKESIGLFSRALESCDINVKFWPPDEHGTSNVSVGLNYHHFNGGWNGCDLNIRLRVHKDGTVIELYR